MKVRVKKVKKILDPEATMQVGIDNVVFRIPQRQVRKADKNDLFPALEEAYINNIMTEVPFFEYSHSIYGNDGSARIVMRFPFPNFPTTLEDL